MFATGVTAEAARAAVREVPDVALTGQRDDDDTRDWLGTLAARLRDQEAVLTGVVFAISTLPALVALSWLVLVSRHTVTPEPHAKESVERRWLERAMSGGFTDVLTASGIALAAIAITGVEIGGLSTLTAVVVLAMVDVAVRYAVLSRRES